MANPKYHWAILVSDPSKHRHAWKAYAGGHYIQACGRKKKSAVGYSAERFAAKVQRNPDWYCTDCAKAARLALAKESAPKMARCKGCPKCRAMSCCGCRHGFAPSDSSQSHHLCDERGPCDGQGNLSAPRSDSDRYAELRKLVEAWQSHIAGSSQALANWSHR